LHVFWEINQATNIPPANIEIVIFNDILVELS